MKLAIFGTGKIVNEFFSFYKDIKNLEILAILSTKRSQHVAEEYAIKYNIKYVCTDVDKILQKDEIDTVYVALPNNLHYDFAKKALLAKKNVICEKPFTKSLCQLKELSKIANDNGLILLEAINNQYLKNYLELKNIIDKTGKIRIVSANYSQYSSRYDDFRNGIIKNVFNPKKAGGALMDLNIYNIHFVTGLFGKPKDVKYFANIQNGIDTSGILILDYGNFKASLIGAKDSFCDNKVLIEAEDGLIIVNNASNEVESIDIEYRNSKKEHIDKKTTKNRLLDEFQKFSEVIKNHDISFAKDRMKQSMIAMEVLEKARKSAEIEFD
ncbi:MAG: Gfo/Idh/MocA family oxidoreductase [Peptoniphilaceae bacterium]|nr:Gfo/Idh/MocA family oxidoreductase [Peptoniphilaceae bacterium]MDY3738640.1 Gfo/Idh/MocA family oxidoreductase [Peptoniphilaceae bacterium]